MNKKTSGDERPFRRLPHLGQRIVKTTVAVFLCLLYYYLRGYRGEDMPTEAVITAILCMQPYVRDTRDYAVNRFAGTLIGAFWGLMFLLLLLVFPSMASNMTLLYVRMALGVLLAISMAVLMASSAAISNLLAGAGIDLAGSAYGTWALVHTVSSYALCCLVVVHLASTGRASHRRSRSPTTLSGAPPSARASPPWAL